MNDTKYLSALDIRDIGILHEVNRLLLHPIGLAMEVRIDEIDEDGFSLRIQDWRDDPEGMIFSEPDAQKAAAFAAVQASKHPVRQAALGYVVQPLTVAS